MADLPRRGEPIIVVRQDTLGGKKLVATEPFQRYLEELDTSQQQQQASPDAEASFLSAFAKLITLEARIGSGDPLTWDETGFSWDSDRLTFDQDEA